ncbi:MAG: V-type ATP synthase subunit K [uncultured Truepera sp.]|uniref:V-type ATP synthase subunit K n=1 Tax=uncultured Truepera sp. TaxID=543023 RepID=A0A6J4V6B4_9DEIN|nr:MAG: V-type ATP synthase subunit K [uncultured Truepera sp.]
MKKVFGLVALLALVSLGFGQEAAEAVAGAGSTLGDGLIAIGAALAIGLAAIGVGIAQASIGSAGAGTLAERPQAFGQILIYLVIPETLIIFGFVIAFFLNGQIG